MTLSPFFRSPFTDITGCLLDRQNLDRCADFEIRMKNCFEAYGMDGGKEKCKDYFDDFKECAFQKKQGKRVMAMKEERLRQIKAGERSKEDAYAPAPRPDSYEARL